MKMTLLTVGKLRTPWAKDACEQYLLRLGPSLAVRELSPSKARDSDRQRDEESVAVLAALEDVRGAVWILDEQGKDMTSVAFAKELGKLADRGEPLTLVLGGAYGFTDAVRSGRTLVRLSAMTLPHELCRVLALEQLYRAAEIRRGSGYHH